MPKPQIVFLVMSAVHSVDAVAELARALAPHTVLVHHDFSQTPDFPLNEPNVVFVTDPKRTGWGIWGYVEGVFHGLEFAVRNLEFDYLQLLSPTCLPIKPLSAFTTHVAAGEAEVDFSGVELLGDRDALMSVGYRAFAPENSWRFRILRRLSQLYFGSSPHHRDVAGVQIRTRPSTDSRGRLPWKARLALLLTRAWSQPTIGRHPFGRSFPVSFGSAWFGAHRAVIAWLVERFRQPDVQRWFPRMHIAEEFMIPTLLRNSPFSAGPYNHCIVTFIGPNPKRLTDEDFERLAQSPAFFARKFPEDPAAPIRRRVLSELVGTTTPARRRSKVATVASV
ncbi:MAG: hypothetical protein ABIP08_13395 [Lautropia sp.]